MKTLAWFASLALCTVAASPALAQYATPRTAPPTRSVLRSAEHVEFAGGAMGSIAYPGGHCGCATSSCAKPICYGYDNCCPKPPLLCCLKRVARMLDCLLPCNKCCPGGCLVDHCRPHLFHRGHCGGCNLGCTTGVPGCSTPLGHPTHLTDPFIDDAPPKPEPEPVQDVRRAPVRTSPVAARAASPYKVSTASEVARQRAISATAAQSAQAPLRRAAAEDAPARTARPARPAEAAPAPPALLPTIRRASAEQEIEDNEIPVNPLRR
jgi:hypothetical protein